MERMEGEMQERKVEVNGKANGHASASAVVV